MLLKCILQCNYWNMRHRSCFSKAKEGWLRTYLPKEWFGGEGRGKMRSILDFVPQAKTLALLKKREVRGRERTYFQAEQCFATCLLGYTQNQGEADRMETLTPPLLPTGRQGTARELSSKTNNSGSHASVVFLQLRSFSKEALNHMNLPGLNLDDSGLRAMSTNCHLE